MSRIAVDFDNTLTSGEGSKYWVDPYDMHPNEEMIDIVRQLYYDGHTVIVYTARGEDARCETQHFLDKWDVTHHALRMGKLGYDVFVDDRTVNPELCNYPKNTINHVLGVEQ